MDTTQGYILTRIDGLHAMMNDQKVLIEKLLAGQKELLKSVEANGSSRLMKLLQYWPQAVAMGTKHVLTVITIAAMVRQGADATSVLDFISKQF